MTAMTEDSSPGQSPESSEPANNAARLRNDLRQAEARAERAERALARIERSAKYTVGSLLVDAAKDPRKLLALPRDMWRVWKMRKSRRVALPVAPRARRDETLDLEAARLLLPRMSARSDRGMSIAGALTGITAQAWSAHAAVTTLLPHDAAALVMAVDADFVVIESAAALPGQPWSHLADPAAADRQAAALLLVDAAHAQGRPVVLLRNTAPWHTVFLDPLASLCDLVLDGPGSSRGLMWHPGIDLATWARIPLGSPDSAAVLSPASAVDALAGPRSTPAQRLLGLALDQAVRRAGMDVVTPDPRAEPMLARRDAIARAGVGLASPLSVSATRVGAAEGTLALLAAGRRVIGGADADLSDLLAGAPGFHRVSTADEVEAGLALSRVPLEPAERRAVLLRLLLGASVPAQLRELARLLHLPQQPGGAWDVSLVADPDSVDQVLLQTWLPREILVSVAPSDRARAALDDKGIRTVVLPESMLRHRASLSTACSTPFVASQVDLLDRDGIADLLVEEVGALPRLSRPTDAALWRVA